MTACRVLIADDVVYFRTLVRYSLDPDRFEVVGEAGDGSEAVRQAAATQPDVVVLDLSMPVMDGLEAIPAIKERSPRTKIVVLSGLEAVDMEAQARELGADAYLEKGTDLDELIQMLTALCADGSGGG